MARCHPPTQDVNQGQPTNPGSQHSLLKLPPRGWGQHGRANAPRSGGLSREVGDTMVGGWVCSGWLICGFQDQELVHQGDLWARFLNVWASGGTSDQGDGGWRMKPPLAALDPSHSLTGGIWVWITPNLPAKGLWGYPHGKIHIIEGKRPLTSRI